MTGSRLFTALAVVVLLGLPGVAAVPAPAPPAPAVRAGQEPGATLYRQSCASCHGVRGEGTQRGPSLVGVGPASVDFQLSTGRMPLSSEDADPQRGDPAFSEAEIAALVDYVAGFGGGGPPIPQVRPGDVQLGRELYLTTCAACHSATGAGGTLTGGASAPRLDEASPTQIAEAVRVGPGRMPAFPEPLLNGEEVDAIAAYVDILQDDRGEQDRGGLPLWRFGPFSEGIVGLLVGLVLLVLVVRWLGSRTR